MIKTDLLIQSLHFIVIEIAAMCNQVAYAVNFNIVLKLASIWEEWHSLSNDNI